MSRLLCIIILFGLIACKPSGHSNQSGRIAIEDSDYYFGIVPDSIQFLTHKFKINNNSSDTCHIIRIEKSCGCTKVKVQDSVIQPNSYIYLDVEVNLGSNYNFFERDINLYTDQQDEPLTVFIRASRNMPKQIISKEFPVKVSDKIRLNIPYVIMGYVSFGESKTASINIINTGTNEMHYSTKLIGAPSYVSVFSENKIGANEIGRIIITVDLSKIVDVWGLQRYSLIVESNNNKIEIPVEAIFVEKLSKKEKSPRILLPIANYTIDTSKKSSAEFCIKNIGNETLSIRNIKTNDNITVLLNSCDIPPQKQDTITVNLPKHYMGTVVIGVSSNDPMEPYKELRVFCNPIKSEGITK